MAREVSGRTRAETGDTDADSSASPEQCPRRRRRLDRPHEVRDELARRCQDAGVLSDARDGPIGKMAARNETVMKSQAGVSIRMKCARDWPGDFKMINSCEEQRLKALGELR